MKYQVENSGLYIYYIFDQNQIECPNQVEITYYIELEKKFTLILEDIIKILQNDSADFDTENIHYFDEENENFILMNSSFSIEIHKKKPELYLTLLLKPENHEVKKQILKLSKEVSDLKEHYNEKLVEIEEIRNSQVFPEINKLASTNLSYLKSMKSLKIGANSSKSYMYNSINVENSLDIAILYADPLISRDEVNKIKILEDPFDYQNECNNLKEFLSGFNQRISIRIDIATVNNFMKNLALEPSILHIFCNGILFFIVKIYCVIFFFFFSN